MSDFRRALAGSRPLLLDGGMGTLLQARGLPPGEQPERFCLRRPDILSGAHADYARAGADIALTCTFGGTRFKLPADLDVEDFNRSMAEAARAATREAGLGRRLFVAGDIGPSGHFPRPLGDVEPADMLAAYREQVRGLVRGGVDLLFAETQFDLAEARLIAAAVRAECDLPLIVSMTFEQGVSLTGTTPEIFVATMANMDVDAIGVNCGAGPEQMRDVARRLLACSPVPVCVQPNAGLPELVHGETVFRLPPEIFAEATADFVAAGARLVGGCCGTRPEHIAALRAAVDSLPAPVWHPVRSPGVALTTRSSLVRLGGDAPLRIIGERINPTGKKQLQLELAADQFDEALRLADEQVRAGALVLDVNVGTPLVDEAAILPALVQRIGARHVEPLSLDSSSVQAIAASLPHVSGSCLVNSITGEADRMEHLGPLCRQWGAPFIVLPIQGRRLPVQAAERIAIIEALLARAEGLGIPRRLVVVDALVLAAASKAEAARETLKTVCWCAERGIPSLIGLSNISFGLPARELVNAAFLSMCAGAGLAACIANPGSARIREAVAAGDVLLGRDAGAGRFVSGYARWNEDSRNETGATAAAAAGAQPAALEQAVLSGDRDRLLFLVEAALAEDADPFALVRERLIPAITEVGARYERKEYFLPQLLRSAQAMQAAFDRVRPLLERAGETARRPVAVLATVEGDIHDIGKNIVGLMLGNHGFEVVDLGKDVRAEDIVDAAESRRAAVIGLSALMTTTMVRMEDTVRLVRERGLKARVLVGGAVVTQAFAERIGADGHAPDAVGAVRVALRVLETPGDGPINTACSAGRMP